LVIVFASAYLFRRESLAKNSQ